MEGKIQSIINDLKHNAPVLPDGEVNEAIAYLNWLTDDNFTFLGYKEYKVGKKGGRDVIRHVNDSELGLLRKRAESTKDKFIDTLQPDVREYVMESRLLSFATSGNVAASPLLPFVS